MATEIIMPKAGMAMEQGTIIQWMKQPGDYVEAGEILLEIETDKVSMEVEAEVSGYLLKTLYGPGDEVPVIQTIGWIGDKDEAVPSGGADAGSSAAPAPPAGDGQSASASAPPGQPGAGDTEPDAQRSAGVQAEPAHGNNGGSAAAGPVRATPAARAIARAHGLDLSRAGTSGADQVVHRADAEALLAQAPGSAGQRISPLAAREADRSGVDIGRVEGSGPGGRVLRQDVAEQGAGRAGAAAAMSGGVKPADVKVPKLDGDQRTRLTGMRRVIAERMSASHLMIPPVTLNAELPAGPLVALKDEFRESGQKVSINDLMLLITARALRDCPWMLVSLDQGEVVQRSAVNLGMAVALPEGLIVPVIRDADSLTLTQLAAQARRLSEAARNHKLGLDDLSGGTFSISNLGMYGITTFTPIINPPEAGILGLGGTRWVADGSGGGSRRLIMDASLTVDHRLIDGAQGALFLRRVAELMEHPVLALA